MKKTEYMATEHMENLSEEELEWQRRRRERVQRMKLEKEKELKKQRMLKLALPIVAIVLVVGIVVGVSVSGGAKDDKPEAPNMEFASAQEPSEESDQESSAEDSSGQEALSEPIEEAQQGAEWNSEEQTVEEPSSEAVVMQGTSVSGVTEGSGESETKAPIIATNAGQYEAHTTNITAAPPGEVDSSNVVFIDLESGDVLAQKGYKEVVNPASMTKVLTVLVAAEHVTNLDDTFTMTVDITDYSYVNDCSNVGFEVGEVVTVRDLFYGTVLPSGGDAAVALATYVAGSHEAFVDMMNTKLEELGLSDTAHFTNCVGLYDKAHHCSVYDMAMIMEAALENDLCREILGARTYTTSATAQHPEGITVSNWFIRRIEDKDTGGKVLGAKTGYVNESGSCAVSYGQDAAGNGYVCVTAGAHSSWRCIYDHVALYKAYAEE